MITRLLGVRGGRPGKTVQMTEVEVRALCVKSREIFLSQERRLALKITRLIAIFLVEHVSKVFLYYLLLHLSSLGFLWI